MQIPKEINQDAAILILCSAIVSGVQRYVQKMQEINSSLDVFTTRTILEMAAQAVPRDVVLHHPDIAYAVRNAYVGIFARDREGDSITHTLTLQNQLREIFPFDLSIQLADAVMKGMQEDVLAERPVLSEKQDQAFQLRLDNLRLHALWQSGAASTRKPYQGPTTRLVPCPQCKTPKRVDKNTKRFQCKATGCNFNQPYPFPPQTP